MAKRVKLNPMPKVKTVVNAFEIRKRKNRIVFSDQKDLKDIFDMRESGIVHDQDQRFIDGNYSVSVLNYSENKPVVVIYQENVDPCAAVEKTMQSSNVIVGPSIVKMSDGLNRMNDIDSTVMFYVINDFPHDQIPVAYLSNGVYKLTWNNTQIGFTVNLAAILGAGSTGYTGIVLQDPDNGSFALVLWSSNEVEALRIAKLKNFTLSMASCLYVNIYRSYHNNGSSIDNPYYGPNGASDFDFTRLPDNIFVKILHQLPFSKRVHCRRVSQRWLSMANTALAVYTKNLDTRYFNNMKPHQFQVFLPLVSDCLEHLTLAENLMVPGMLDTFSTIGLFPVLRELHFYLFQPSIDNAALFYMLDRSPKLKMLATPIPTNLPIQFGSHGPCTVEKLTVRGEQASELHLVAFLEFFPNLSYLRIINCAYVTASCISFVLEKYASKLHELEIIGNFDSFKLWPHSPFGAITGIQMCTNLKRLSLSQTNFVSDVLMVALAAGCHKLEMLHIGEQRELTNEGLAALAVLPNLTQLEICSNGMMNPPLDFSDGVTIIAREGRLTKLMAYYITLSAACLKTLVRHCRHLKLLCTSPCDGAFTIDDAIEIVRLYGVWSMESRLELNTIYYDTVWRNENAEEVIRQIRETIYYDAVWRNENVEEVIRQITETNDRQFVLL